MWVHEMRQANDQPAGLIRVLLDSSAEYGDRHDAALALSGFTDDSAEQALAGVACDERADSKLVDVCGQSLAEIWCTRSRISDPILIRLTTVSLHVALATLRQCSPSLLVEAERILKAAGRLT